MLSSEPFLSTDTDSNGVTSISAPTNTGSNGVTSVSDAATSVGLAGLSISARLNLINSFLQDAVINGHLKVEANHNGEGIILSARIAPVSSNSSLSIINAVVPASQNGFSTIVNNVARVSAIGRDSTCNSRVALVSIENYRHRGDFKCGYCDKQYANYGSYLKHAAKHQE